MKSLSQLLEAPHWRYQKIHHTSGASFFGLSSIGTRFGGRAPLHATPPCSPHLSEDDRFPVRLGMLSSVWDGTKMRPSKSWPKLMECAGGPGTLAEVKINWRRNAQKMWAGAVSTHCLASHRQLTFTCARCTPSARCRPRGTATTEQGAVSEEGLGPANHPPFRACLRGVPPSCMKLRGDGERPTRARLREHMARMRGREGKCQIKQEQNEFHLSQNVCQVEYLQGDKTSAHLRLHFSPKTVRLPPSSNQCQRPRDENRPRPHTLPHQLIFSEASMIWESYPHP